MCEIKRKNFIEGEWRMTRLDEISKEKKKEQGEA